MAFSMAADELVVHGAREHNLKDITVRLPRNALICITGLSGSGKSSLAFDTIYAEGQRRYVESLSAYARQFLQMMEKPDVDSIDGLSPAISIDQKTTSRNPRSTVGTVTEIYDYLRLLYARVGRPHCPVCGRPISGQSIDSIVEQILALPEGTRFTVNAPVVRDRKGEYRDLFEELRNEGFSRDQGRRRAAPARGAAGARQEVQAHDRGRRRPARDEGGPAHAADRSRSRPRPRSPRGSWRSTWSTAARRSPTRRTSRAPSTASRCPSCSRASSRSTRRTAPARAAPGSARSRRSTPTCSCPTRSLSIDDGALVPWAVGNSSFYESVIQAIADRYEIPTDVPWQELTERAAGLLPLRHRRRQGLRPVPQPDGPAALVHDRRSRESSPRSSAATARPTRRTQRERIEEYMSFRPCPVCKGARLKPEVLAVTVGEQQHPRVHAASRSPRALQFLDTLDLTETEELIGHRIVKEIRERLTFLDDVGVGYLQLDRASRDALGRRGAAAAARDADRLAARRRALHPRRAVDRPAPARQRQADRHARAAARPRQHRASSSSTTSR